MRRNYYQDLRSLIRSDHYSRLRTLLLVVTLFLALVLFHVALDTLKEEKNIANPNSPDESFQKAVVSVNSHAEQNGEYHSGPVDISDKKMCVSTPNQSKIHLSHELLRRQAIHFVQEIRNAASGQLKIINKTLRQPDILKSATEMDRLLNKVDTLNGWLEEMTRYLQVDLEGLGRVNGKAESRQSELDQLARHVQGRIDKLQNPSDCSKAKLLVVGLTRPCAFGCNVHHLAYCFQLAYISGRTLVFDKAETAYDSWWTANFLPLSNTCKQLNIADSEHIPLFDGTNATSTIRVTRCDYIGSMSNSVKSLPPAIPTDLASDLERLHGAPFVWFIGHLTAYLMRPTKAFEQLLNSTLEAYKLVGFNRNPVVGVHVRRTDKINYEAAFHPLHEYITHVERRFKFWQSQRQMLSKTDEWNGDTHNKQRVQSPITRRVFIATDDPSVFEEAKKYYPQYVFEGDSERARSADVSRRTQADSITGIALDILVLSRTDFLVCTFSSQVCRVAYELMQTRHTELGDASGLAWSLDSIYYFGGQQSNPYKTIIADEATGAKPGDLFHMDGNSWNGYADLHSIQNNKKVILPAYKVFPRVLSVEITEVMPV